MAQVNDRYQESRDIWNDYNSRQEFEHDLINRKTTWWLTTQTILFAAYGVTLTIQFRSLAEFRNSPEFRAVTEFRNVIAGVGLAVAVVTLIGVLALIRSKYRSWAMYQDFYRRFTWYSLPRPLNEEPLQWGVLTNNTWFTLLPDFALPVVFGGAWLFVLVRCGFFLVL